VTEVSEAIEIDEIAALLPGRLHTVMDRFVQETPDYIALVEDGSAWSYRELDKHVREVARQLASLGVRAGDRMMIVSENCIALAALLFAASRLDAWAIVANPRLSAREIDQIRDHSGARRLFFTTSISKEAAGDRRQRAEPCYPGRAGGRRCCQADRRPDLHFRHDRHAEGRDAVP
jgi:long-chain acyl-CoA synthetase